LPSGVVPTQRPLLSRHSFPAASQFVPVFPALRLSSQNFCILPQSALMHLPMSLAFCAKLGPVAEARATIKVKTYIPYLAVASANAEVNPDTTRVLATTKRLTVSSRLFAFQFGNDITLGKDWPRRSVGSCRYCCQSRKIEQPWKRSYRPITKWCRPMRHPVEHTLIQ